MCTRQAAPAASALRKARAGHDDTAQQLRFKYRRQLPASQCSCQWDKCYDACRAPQHARCGGMLSSLQDKLTRLREGDTAVRCALSPPARRVGSSSPGV